MCSSGSGNGTLSLWKSCRRTAIFFCVTTAMMRYAKAIAHAVTDDVGAAEREAAGFDEALTRVPESRYVFNNRCLDILAIAGEMMRGEIEYRRGRFDTAFRHLRAAVELDDTLPYDEPWGWMQPDAPRTRRPAARTGSGR